MVKLAAAKDKKQTIDFNTNNLVFDATSLEYILDEPFTQRMVEGGVNVTLLNLIENDWDKSLKAIESSLSKIEKNPNLMIATNGNEIEDVYQKEKIAVILGFQNSAMIEKEFWRLGILYNLGIRSMQLTYTEGNLYGDGCGEKRNAGLTFLGMELIEAINEYDIWLDLSHCGHQTTYEAIQLANAPVCTHANAYGLNNNDRNKYDETIKALVEKNGVIGVCCLPRSVKPENPTLDDVANHIDYIVSLVGHENVGIGLDFTEGYQERKVILPEAKRWRTYRPDIFGEVDAFLSQRYPEGLDSISFLPNLTQTLFDRGYDEEQVRAILGGNWLRNFRSVVG